jgi:hypothetical protein
VILAPHSTPRVTIANHAIWRVRLTREMPRYLLVALALTGIAASARFTIAPPHARLLGRAPIAATPDRAAEAFAVLFARRFLSWNAADPLSSARSLEPFLGAGANAASAVQLPAQGTQTVEWAEVAQARERGAGEHVYTVAAQTDASGLLYLTVGVTRLAGGALALSGEPAFVGPPATTVEPPAAQPRAVEDPNLVVVVRRALSNYLSGSRDELAADLTLNARVSLPSTHLAVDEVTRLGWAPGEGTVIAVVEASDVRGAGYTLAYEVDVARAQGRWEISAVQMDPDAG